MTVAMIWVERTPLRPLLSPSPRDTASSHPPHSTCTHFPVEFFRRRSRAPHPVRTFAQVRVYGPDQMGATEFEVPLNMCVKKGKAEGKNPAVIRAAHLLLYRECFWQL